MLMTIIVFQLKYDLGFISFTFGERALLRVSSQMDKCRGIVNILQVKACGSKLA